MQALKSRRSERRLLNTKLSMQHLSEVLWAANGVNSEDGKRTAPSAMNRHAVDVYVVLEEGVYLYDPIEHHLHLIAKGDFRKLVGKQDFVYTAPVNLVYVADMSKFENLPRQAPYEERLKWAHIEAGHKAQNVYLYCASEGLAAVVRTSIDGEAFSKAVGLGPKQIVIAAQTVGYPRREG
ncbi:MAG: SagB/ThcOx family dehydrogenase [Candidatus Bathyarchaeia archaeon]